MLPLQVIFTAEGPLTVFQEVSFNMLDTADGGLLNSMRRLLSEIFIPALRATSQGCGELEGLQEAASIRQEFLSSLEGFVSVLSGAQESLKEKVRGNKLFLQKLSDGKEISTKYGRLPFDGLNSIAQQMWKNILWEFLLPLQEVVVTRFKGLMH